MKTDETVSMLPPTANNNDARAILKARARALARVPDRQAITAKKLEIVEFRLASERYAVEQAYVQEVHPLRELTPLPCTPAFILGILNIRGQILPVMDIKKFFQLPETGITDLHVVIVVRLRDVELGILADAIGGVRSIASDTVQASLPTLTGIRAKYLKGVTNEHIVILDVPSILTDPKLMVDEEVQG